MPEAFDLSSWAEVSPAGGWTFLAGQLADDSRLDIGGCHPSDRGNSAKRPRDCGETCRALTTAFIPRAAPAR